MGFYDEILYRNGKENVAADGLSRVTGAQLLVFTLSTIHTNLLQQVQASYTQDPSLQQLIQSLAAGQQQDLLKGKGKLVGSGGSKHVN